MSDVKSPTKKLCWKNYRKEDNIEIDKKAKPEMKSDEAQ